MLHGDMDEVTPIANADKAQALLIANGKQCEYVVYPGASHAFESRAPSDLDREAAKDAKQNMFNFLKENLQ